MDSKMSMQVQLNARNREEACEQLTEVARRVVNNLSEQARDVLLVDLVLLGLFQHAGETIPVDAVEMLRDIGLSFGGEAEVRWDEKGGEA